MMSASDAKARGSRRRRADACATILFWAASAIVGIIIAALLGYVIWHGSSALSWHFLTSLPNEEGAGGGIGPEIFNSFYILILTLLMTVPLALAVALYLDEYALPGMMRSSIVFATEALATVPSIVMGLFGMLLFVFVLRWRFSALGGAMTLTLLNLPAMIRMTQQALQTVPASLREASLALGATKWRTITRVVLPGAIASLTTGVILIAGRVFGETAALIYTAGVSVPSGNPYDIGLFHPAETLSVHLWYTHAEGLATDAERIGDGSALILVFMLFCFNLTARYIGGALARKTTGR
jgi:phosphate transport system permease protein